MSMLELIQYSGAGVGTVASQQESKMVLGLIPRPRKCGWTFRFSRSSSPLP